MSESNEAITVVIPCRDFAKGLPRFLDGWREAFQKLGRHAQFVVIDDSQAGVETAASASDVAVIQHSTKGLGAALRAIQESEKQSVNTDRNEPVLMVVPDFGYRPSDLRPIWDAFKDVDMVIGVRPGQGMPQWLSCVKRIAAFLRRCLFGIPVMDSYPWYGWPVARRRLRYRFIYGPRIQDPETGLLLVRRSILDRCPIQSEGAFAILELIAKANFLGATMTEVKLSKPSDAPIMKGRFENHLHDERIVFRHPTFLPAQITTGTDEGSSIPAGTG
jgi:hypothetical protein